MPFAAYSQGQNTAQCKGNTAGERSEGWLYHTNLETPCLCLS